MRSPMKRTAGFVLAAAFVLPAGIALPGQHACASTMKWQELDRGVHYAAVEIQPGSSPRGNSLHVVRIDPKLSALQSVAASCADSVPKTAAEWCRTRGLTAAINLGMFEVDRLTNVGYARCGPCVNSRHWSAYKSVLVFRPKRSGIPSAAILDLDTPGSRERAKDYECAVQNLRLIKGPGRNVWTRQAKRWSEAAIAQDADGKILFLFCRAPYTMWDFNHLLLRLPLKIVKAMHVEGGPEASLSIRSKALNLDLNGSYETGFREIDDGSGQWPIPNVIGVLPRSR